MNAAARMVSALARWLLPPGRRGWGDAMRAEVDYLSGRDALRWASGCLYAALQERLNMNTGDFRISRWAMLVETVGCFAPMSLAWYEISFGMPGLFRQDWAELSKIYAGMAGGTFVIWFTVLGAIVGWVGLAGLALGLRYFVTGKGLRSPIAGCGLIVAPLLYMLADVAGLFIGPSDWRLDSAMLLLFVVLPIAGIAHLMWLARPAAPRDVGALAAS